MSTGSVKPTKPNNVSRGFETGSNSSAQNSERVILVHVNFPAGKMEQDLAEFQELAVSAGAQVVSVIVSTRSVPTAKYFIGSGKVQEIRDAIAASQVQAVIFNHVLTSAQERNLERVLHCRVLDRTELILDIFAQRAQSSAGKMQVELAQLKHLSTRLVRGWTHLERQRGGIGLRGPGETQLETDRRLLRKKIKIITERLEKLHGQRELARRARRKAVVPTVALVGYTNAGKSTLFNRLTDSHIYTANKLFATLDPTLRRVHGLGPEEVILADTVGFIRHLPHALIQAFHATLEEVSQADLLLLVVDAQDDQKKMHIEQVLLVLEELHANEIPRILVYNKIDLRPDLKPGLERNEFGQVRRVFISAQTGEGINELLASMDETLKKEVIEKKLILKPEQAKTRALLYAQAAVVSETVDEEGNYHLLVRLPQRELMKLLRAMS